MPLIPGTRLGPYEIAAAIGAGGMGEVYRATDSNLKRAVAIKVLPTAVAGDADRLARFQREAEVLAALNHPNIAAIYGLEKTPDLTALVMELVEGEDLSVHIARGALPIADALPIAKQIADALEAAHEAGIVHRDLKPANIKVRADGTVKVLDFGLAKAVEPSDALGSHAANSPTLTARATAIGMIIGTAAYMAPEQAKGKPVDKRADIWAFGVVLYEMLAGRRAFEGEDISTTLAAVLMREPEWTSLPADTPRPIRTLLRQCLERDPRERAPDIAVARFAIREALAAPAETDAPVVNTASRAFWKQPAVALLAVALVVATATTTWWLVHPGPVTPAPVARFVVPLPLGAQDYGNPTSREVAVSPMGTHLAFEWNQNLWVRSLSEAGPRMLVSGLKIRAPFFSPDGQQIGFFANDQVMRVAVSGGAPVVVGGPVRGRPLGVSWCDDGFIYVGISGSIARLPATGGLPEIVIQAKDGERASGPQVLEGGQWILFTLLTGPGDWDEARVVAESLSTHERRVLVNGGRSGRVTTSGHLLYVFGGVLFGQAFDSKTVAVKGGPVPLVEDVRTAAASFTGDSYYDISSRGDLVYAAGATGIFSPARLAWTDRLGVQTSLPFDPQPLTAISLAPDGRRIAAEVGPSQNNSDIWLYAVDRPGAERLTSTGHARSPVWSFDGQWVYFGDWGGPGEATGGSAIWRRRSDLSGAAEKILSLPDGVGRPWSVSADGKQLLLAVPTASGSRIGVLALDGRSTPTWLTGATEAYSPSVSPDGRFVAYASGDPGGTLVIAVVEVATGRSRMISAGVGEYPVWARTGKEIFFWSDDKLESVQVVSADRMEFAAPVPLYSLPAHRTPFAVTADGQRFIQILPLAAAGQAARPEIHLVLNWFEELKAKVPVK